MINLSEVGLLVKYGQRERGGGEEGRKKGIEGERRRERGSLSHSHSQLVVQFLSKLFDSTIN